MITLDLDHLFKTDPNSTKVPRIVFDWVMEREDQFSDMEFQVSFVEWGRFDKKVKEVFNQCERAYAPMLPRTRCVEFPLKNGIWRVRVIGEQMRALEAMDLTRLLKSEDPRMIVINPEKGVDLRGYARISPVTELEEAMMNIRCDRNINDEWTFRGSPQEFLDEHGLS